MAPTGAELPTEQSSHRGKVMKELARALFAFLLVFGQPAQAAETVYRWDTVTNRVNGDPVTGAISYMVRHNGTEIPARGESLTVDSYPEVGSESCVSALEAHEHYTLQSAWNCIVIHARPETPTFRMIQLIE